MLPRVPRVYLVYLTYIITTSTMAQFNIDLTLVL